MDLFNRKKSALEDIPKPIMREPAPIMGEQELLKEQMEEIEEEPSRRIDEDTARIQFRILVRELYDLETQLKKGKPEEVDELRRDKIPTINMLMNKADMVKLDMKILLEGFKAIGYGDSDVNNLKKEALSKNDYVFFTL